MALVLWLGLGLGRKPEERPEEGERDGAALLLGVLRGLLEVERAGSCRTTGWLLSFYYPLFVIEFPMRIHLYHYS